jgi:hypothetical protein
VIPKNFVNWDLITQMLSKSEISKNSIESHLSLIIRNSSEPHSREVRKKLGYDQPSFAVPSSVWGIPPTKKKGVNNNKSRLKKRKN